MLPVGRAAIGGTLRTLGGRVPALLRRVGNPSARAVGTWTIGEVGAHLVSLAEMYPRILRGEGSPRASNDTIARDNREEIEQVGTTDVLELADRFAAAAPACVEALDEAPEEVGWHGGLVVPPEAVAAVLATEYAVHGHDIATAARLSWRIRSDDATTAVRGLAPLLPHYVDEQAAAGVDARIRVRLRGDDRPPLTLHFRDGGLQVTASGDGRADCTIWADPVTWTLVSFGRLSPLWPVLTGRILAWGRRPWLAVRLQSLLPAP